MSSLQGRLKRLELQRVDLTGLAPYSEAWFVLWDDKLDRVVSGEDIGSARIPLVVIDRILAQTAGDGRGSQRPPRMHP